MSSIHTAALLTINLLTLFALACGGGNNGGGPEPDQNTQFSVRVAMSDGSYITPIGYGYPRCPNNVDCLEPGDAGWTNAAGSFDYLQTAQFVIEPGGATPVLLQVADEQNQSQCMVTYYENLFNANDDYFELGFSDPNNGYPISAGDLATGPIHLTLIPITTQNNCANPDEDTDADRALAVWISERPAPPTPEAGEVVCNLNANMNFDQPVDDGNCTIDVPTWRTDVTATYGRVLYTGTLWSMMTRDPQPDKITVNLADDLSLPLPINTAYAAFYFDQTDPAMVSSCQEAVQALNQGQSPSDACVVENRPFQYLFTLPTTAAVANQRTRFSINGFGRISGFKSLERWDPNVGVTEPGSGNPTIPLNQFKDYAEFRISSYLLGLSSSYPSEPINTPSRVVAIEVNNITVGWTAKLQDGAVELNSEYLPVEENPDAYNEAASLFDYKQVGSWVGQSDGPELLGQETTVDFSYLHVADDAIKVAAPNVRFDNITVIKGNSGGVVNIGSYGKNRGVDGSLVENIWVPRVVQGDSSVNNIGLVISNTCPYEQALTGATIDTLYVPSLGAGGGANSIRSLVQLGVVSCDAQQTTFRIGDIKFLNFEIYLPAPTPSLLYAEPNTAPGGGQVQVNWDPVFFYDYDPVNPTASPFGKPAVINYPDSSGTGYYVCGPEKRDRCWTTNGQNTNQPLNLLDYSGTVQTGTAIYPGFNE